MDTVHSKIDIPTLGKLGFFGYRLKEAEVDVLQPERSEEKTGWCGLPYESGGICVRGAECPRKHVPEQVTFFQIPRRRIRGVGIREIPKQPAMADGVTFMAKVLHAENPSEFYILPESDLNCLCSKPFPQFDRLRRNNETLQQTTFDRFVEKLSDTIFSDVFGYTNSQRKYVKDELVACRVHQDDKQEWQRAIVLEDYHCRKHDANALVKLRLLDLGKRVQLPGHDVAVYPRKKFVEVKRYTYKCSLYGVIPIGPDWTDEETECFRNFVFKRRLLVEIKRPVLPDQVQRHSPDLPYQVLLSLPQLSSTPKKLRKGKGRSSKEQNKCLYVNEEMIKMKMATGINAFPHRPEILRRFSNDIMSEPVVGLLDPYPSTSKGIPENIVDAETTRLRNKLVLTSEDRTGEEQDEIIHVNNIPRANPTNIMFRNSIFKHYAE